MSQYMQPTILLLRDGTDTSQGKAQLISNINACGAVADAVRTTLGPRGLDKLIHHKGKVTISNDGATILKELDIIHPAASTLVDISKAQDAEVGDGTTSVTVLGYELLREAKPYIEDGVHPQIIMRAYRKAAEMGAERVKELSMSIESDDPVEQRDLLKKCAMTAMNSKLISMNKEFFADIVVDAVLALDEDLDMDMIGIKKVAGGAVEDSFFVQGVAFKKSFSYAGFEQQQKSFKDVKILLLNVELELKSEKENAEIRLEDPEKYQSIVDAEWNIIYDKLDKIVKSGAQIVLSRLAIGDLATQYFADRGLFCAGRVEDMDLQRVSKATGGKVQTSVNDLIPEILGFCENFEEKQVGSERFNVFSGCPGAKTASIVLRGGAEQFIEESERSLIDSIMITRRAMKVKRVIPGGGAIEMEISKYLRDYSRTIHGKPQLLVNAFAKALEALPRQIAENAGFDATSILNKLRMKHASGNKWFGIDMENEDVADCYEKFIWEPSIVKINALQSAAEAACVIMSIDETVKNNESEQSNAQPVSGPRAGGLPSMRPMQ